MDKIKMGYVGCGFMAQVVHIPNILNTPDIELVAIAEIREKLGKKIQEKYKIPKLFKDHLALAQDPEITAVGVSGHFVNQGEIAADLLLAGKNVFMEKPMAVSVKQAEKILQAEEKGGSRLMVAYMKRYDMGNELAKRIIDELKQTGNLGKIIYARNHGFCGRSWTAGGDSKYETTDEPIPATPEIKIDWLPEKYTNQYIGYLQQYTHNVNLIRYLLDSEKTPEVKFVDLDTDSYTGIVIFEVNNIRVAIESGTSSYYGWEEHTQVYFEHGWVKISSPPLFLRNAAANVEIYEGGDIQNFSIPFPGWGWSYKREIEHFADCLKNNKPFRSSGQDALNDVRFFENVFKMLVKKENLS